MGQDRRGPGSEPPQILDTYHPPWVPADPLVPSLPELWATHSRRLPKCTYLGGRKGVEQAGEEGPPFGSLQSLCTWDCLLENIFLSLVISGQFNLARREL